jgi:hypothetical protein
MSLDIFQRSSGPTQVARNAIAYSAEALAAMSVKRWHSSVVAQCGVYLGKNQIHFAFTFTHGPDAVERYRPSLGGRDSFSTQVPNWESLKVIALDKIGVNSNLSSGNQSPQIAILQYLVHKSYCIK